MLRIQRNFNLTAIYNETIWQNSTFYDIMFINGTFVNERRLEPDQETDLSNGDILRVGRTSMRFEYGAA